MQMYVVCLGHRVADVTKECDPIAVTRASISGNQNKGRMLHDSGQGKMQ